MNNEPEQTKKKAIGRHRGLTEKRKTFAKAYARTKNATESAMVAYETTTRNVAGSIGSDLLRNPQVQSLIQKLLDKEDMHLSEVVRIHKRNMMQEKHLPTSQKAVETAYELHGVLNTKTNNSVQVAFIIEQ